METRLQLDDIDTGQKQLLKDLSLLWAQLTSIQDIETIRQ
jgi:hypothetical protein